MENASFVGEGRTGATSDSPARNGIRRSATLRRRTTATNDGLPEQATFDPWAAPNFREAQLVLAKTPNKILPILWVPTIAAA